MKLVGLMVARDEQWVLDLSARAALLWCDELVILNHNSGDITPLIIESVQEENPTRVTRLWAEGPWNEADYRQMMLTAARDREATHCVVIDADEVLTANLIPTIRDTIEAAGPWEMLRLPWLILWKGKTHYRTDGMWGQAYAFTAFADAPNIRWGEVGGMQFHTRYPGGVHFRNVGTHAGGGMMHLQFFNWRRAVAKQVWYAMQEMLRYPNRTPVAEINARYGRSLDEAGATLAPVPVAWWEPYRERWERLQEEQRPWQADEVRRLVAEHGRERFAGLDLRGVA